MHVELTLQLQTQASARVRFVPSAPAMPIQYRVIDLANPAIDPDERIVQSTSPERAVMEALGVEVVRSGSKRDLRARVYFQYPGQPLSMVRLYSKLESRQV